jgi:hypothetical protein
MNSHALGLLIDVNSQEKSIDEMVRDGTITKEEGERRHAIAYNRYFRATSDGPGGE